MMFATVCSAIGLEMPILSIAKVKESGTVPVVGDIMSVALRPELVEISL